jgi:hypothetical protein
MAAGGRAQLLGAISTITMLRSYHGCELPIEVFYCTGELPAEAVFYLTQLESVRVVDVLKIAGIPHNVDFRGFQIKPLAIMMSSFEQVLWLDSDNIPLINPDDLFDDPSFTSAAALFWPDYCNMRSLRAEGFKLFGMDVPGEEAYPDIGDGQTAEWLSDCVENYREIESGQILINKHRSWSALNVMLFICFNHDYFLSSVFFGDKQVFVLAFQYTHTSFNIVQIPPTGAGIRGYVHGQTTLCANTMMQHHPSTHHPIFMHRTLAKFKDPWQLLHLRKQDPKTSHAWRYMATQQAYDPWLLVYRNQLPSKLFLGDSRAQHECVLPARGSVIRKIPSSVSLHASTRQCCHIII